MRKPITAIVTAAAIAAAVMAQPKPAEARCWGCWVSAGVVAGGVIAGGSHEYTYDSFYGPYFAYPPYSGYGYAPYGYYYAPALYYGGYGAPPCCAYAAPLYAHHHSYHRRYW